jgi:rare lipoprotein A (peptidoglycan hydrolase)
MVVIPLVALGAGGGAAARGAVAAPAATARGGLPAGASAGPAAARAAAAGRAGATGRAGAPDPDAQLLLQVEAAAAAHAAPVQLSTPLAVAAAAPAASAAAVLPKALPPARPRASTVVAPHVVVAAPPPAQVTHVVAPAPPAHVEEGLASWYDAPPGTCASPSLPFGSVLTVTNVATGATTTCRVDDRGPYAGGRVIDLSPDVFARLAPLGVGVATVRVTW